MKSQTRAVYIANRGTARALLFTTEGKEYLTPLSEGVAQDHPVSIAAFYLQPDRELKYCLSFFNHAFEEVMLNSSETEQEGMKAMINDSNKQKNHLKAGWFIAEHMFGFAETKALLEEQKKSNRLGKNISFMFVDNVEEPIKPTPPHKAREKMSEQEKHDADFYTSLQRLGFRASRLIQIGPKKFYLTPTIIKKEDGRLQSVLYYERKPGQFQARFVYLSYSGGNWRYTPLPHWRFGYFKGAHDFHYTQETALADKIVSALWQLAYQTPAKNFAELENLAKNKQIPYDLLEAIEDNLNYLPKQETPPSSLSKVFVAQHEKSAPEDGFGSSYSQYDDKKVLAFLQKAELAPGNMQLLPNKTWDETINEINKNTKKINGFLPDFSQTPIQEYKTSHAILSLDEKGNYLKNIAVRVYPGLLNDQTIWWYLYHDPDGRAWVEKIVFPESLDSTNITPFGTYAHVIHSGPLTNKPFEYTAQCRDFCLHPQTAKLDTKYVTTNWQKGWQRAHQSAYDIYVDISPFLSQISPIREYKAAFHLGR